MIWDWLNDNERALLGDLFSQSDMYSTVGRLKPHFARPWGMPAFNAAIWRLESNGLIEPVRVKMGKDLVVDGRRLTAAARGLMTWRVSITEDGMEKVDENPVTKFPSLGTFERDLESLLAEAQKTGAPVAVAYIDLDRFKSVNDKHGHDVGNEVLSETIARLAAIVKGKGRVYHPHGEEMTAILPNHSAQEALAVLERFRSVLEREPMAQPRIIVTASIGIAVSPEHGREAAHLTKNAETAMREVKEKCNRNYVRVFGEPLPEKPTPRATTRRDADMGMISDSEAAGIRADYFTRGRANCPRDGAVLRVEEASRVGSVATDLHVRCPMCGLEGPVVSGRA